MSRMQKDRSVEQWQRADEEARKNLPPEVKLVRTLRGHTDTIGRIAWSPDGRMLASPSDDKTIRLWDDETGECLCTIKGEKDEVNCVAFDPTGCILASGSFDKTVKAVGGSLRALLHTLAYSAIPFSKHLERRDESRTSGYRMCQSAPLDCAIMRGH